MPQSTTGVAAGAADDSWRVAIVEDHLLQRMLTRHVINAAPGMRVSYAGETLPAFVEWLRTAPTGIRPHLLLLDLMVDHGPPADPAHVRRLVSDGMKVGIFSAVGSPALVRQMLRAGATGVIGKRDSVDEILRAVAHMLDGREWTSPSTAALIAQDPDRPQLSEQEERTLVLYASGLTLDAVAAAIGVQRDTAKTYLRRVKEKYQAAGRRVSTKIELRDAATSDGLLDG